jgi:ABC-type multidrug transport system permease subunit
MFDPLFDVLSHACVTSLIWIAYSISNMIRSIIIAVIAMAVVASAYSTGIAPFSLLGLPAAL